MSEERVRDIRSRLLRWYAAHRRELPWRQGRDPYAIWVSEIMLQQTQVETVLAYFDRFMARFPTVQALAQAEPGEVMKAWEGLGYYTRARHLHAAAREIVSRHGGELPQTLDGLLALPGIGRYTAGALLSIAFGQPVPVLDGNVARVLSRLLHVTERIDEAATRQALWAWATHLAQGPRPDDLNQSLMELGALVCRPRSPLCTHCPLMEQCQAHALGIQTLLPVKRPRKRIPHYQVTAGVIYGSDGRFLITLRPSKGLLGGLWEFPGGKQEEGEGLEACLRREIREELEIDIEVGQRWLAIDHAYTHFRITLHVFEARYVGGKIVCHAADDFRWVTADELDAYAFPAADRQIITLLREQE